MAENRSNRAKLQRMHDRLRIPAQAALKGMLIGIPVLLFAPALYYSLMTPIGLIDSPLVTDHHKIFASAHNFLGWLRVEFFATGVSRFRPFLDILQALNWQLFGQTDWLHRLSRWLFHFAGFFAFAAAFLRIARSDPKRKPAEQGLPPSLARLLPPTLLAWIWLFFPNLPAARLYAQEPYTVFFLGLCNYAIALTLPERNGSTQGGQVAKGAHALFLLGFLGLVFSKEINLAVALWLLLFWNALLFARGTGSVWKRLRSGLPAAACFLFAFHRILSELTRADIGYSHSLNLDSSLDHVSMVLRGLFQMETSGLIAAGFAILCAILSALAIVRILGKRFDRELLFILLLLGEFASMLAALGLSYGVSLRYWYILVPVFATLLAFSAKFLLEALRNSKALAWGAAAALAGFATFFVAANYYDFLHQVLAVHSERQAHAKLKIEVARLLNAGEHVQVSADDWFREELSALRMGYYDGHWPDIYQGNRQLRTEPPRDPKQPYYLLDYHQHAPSPMPIHATLVQRADYPLLSHARKIARFLQGKAPHASVDWGVSYLGSNHWSIYALPRSMDDYLADLVEEAGAPLIRAKFDVHLNENRLLYVKRPCAAEDIEARFLLHLFPMQANDLPEEWRRHRMHNLDFEFEHYGIRNDRICLAVRQLPNYPIAGIATGQFGHEGGRPVWEEKLWEERIAFLDPFRSIYQAFRTEAPIIRGRFDVHLHDNALVYIRESCAPEDLASWFYLHLFPENPDDLPEERRRHGFDNLDFPFDRQGAAFDGKCLAVRQLPNYPIAGIATGQFGHEGGRPVWEEKLWEERIAFLDPFRSIYQAFRTEAPIIRERFDVHLRDNALVYIRESCAPEDLAPWFYLHLFPENPDDLPEERRRHGFDNLDFPFDLRGAAFDGKCVAQAWLPDYAIKSISTGQYGPEGRIWGAEFSPRGLRSNRPKQSQMLRIRLKRDSGMTRTISMMKRQIGRA